MSDEQAKKKPKPVSEMSLEEYITYLNQVEQTDFMHELAHDIKGQVSLIHGYIDLIQWDIEEDAFNSETVTEYMAAMTIAIQRIYMCLEGGTDSYPKHIDNDGSEEED